MSGDATSGETTFWRCKLHFDLMLSEIQISEDSKSTRNCVKMAFKLPKSWSVHNLNEGWKKRFLSKKLNVRWCYKRGDHFSTSNVILTLLKAKSKVWNSPTCNTSKKWEFQHQKEIWMKMENCDSQLQL